MYIQKYKFRVKKFSVFAEKLFNHLFIVEECLFCKFDEEPYIEFRKMKKSLFTLSILFVSVLLGIISAKYDLIGIANSGKYDFGELLFKIGLVYVLALALGYFQVIIHEIGHLVCGLATGYRFVSFRFKSYVLVKVNKQYQIKRFAIPGTGGQCLMDPPGSIDIPGSSILYLLGGVSANLLLTILFLLLALFGVFSTIVNFSLLVGAFVGLVIIVTNGIPMLLSGIPNDMMNIRILRKSQTARRAMFLSLKVNALQSNGTRLATLPLSWFDIPNNETTSSYFTAMILLLREGWYLDNYAFDKAKDVMDLVEQEATQKDFPQILRFEMNVEKLFLLILNGTDKDEVRQFYEAKAKFYINRTKKFMLGKQRTLWAYTYFIENDISQSRLIYEQMLRMREQYPVIAEAQSEIDLVDYLLTGTSKIL